MQRFLFVSLFLGARIWAVCPDDTVTLSLAPDRPGTVIMRHVEGPDGLSTLQGEVVSTWRGQSRGFYPTYNPHEIYVDTTCLLTAEPLTVRWCGDKTTSISVPAPNTTPVLDVESDFTYGNTIDIKVTMPNAVNRRRLRAIFLRTNDILLDLGVGGTDDDASAQTGVSGAVGPVLIRAVSCESKIATAVVDTGGEKDCGKDCQPRCTLPDCAGDPVNTAGLNMRYEDSDPLPGFILRRTYDSRVTDVGTDVGLFGIRWFSAFDATVKTFTDYDGSQFVTVVAPDRSWTVFERIGAEYRVIAPSHSRDARLVQLADGSWRHTLPGGRESWSYNSSGKLSAITDTRTGRATRFEWSVDLPTRIDDSWGNWGFSVSTDATSRRITAITPDGRPDLAWRYIYEYHLARVESPVGTWRTYAYGMPNHTWTQYFRLLSARDGGGHLIESHDYYDSSGRTNTSFGPSDEIVQMTNGDGRNEREKTTTVVYKNGRSETHYLRFIAGKWRPVEVSSPCASCGQKIRSVVHDASGNVTRAQAADGYITTNEYDAAGVRRLRTTTNLRPETCDPATSSCLLTTDGLNTVALTPTPETQEFEYSYDDANWPDLVTSTVTASVRNPGQTRTELVTYHALTGDVLTRAVTGWTDTPARQETRTTTTVMYTGTEGAAFDPGGAFSAAWLALPQPLRARSTNGPRTDVTDTTDFVYYPVDPAAPAGWRGELAAVRNALGQVTRFEDHDPFGNPRRVIDANGVVTDTTFDALGRRLTTTTRGVPGCDTGADPLCATDLTSTMTYTGAGPLIRTELPRGGVTSYTYDTRGRIATVSRGPSATDLRERVETTYDPNTGKKELERTLAFENGAWVEKRRVGYVYNPREELSLITYPGGASSGFAYDDAGRLSALRDENHTQYNTTYAHDPEGRVREVKQTLGTGQIITSYTYDLHGNLTSVTDPNGNVTSYTYDDFGQLLEQVSPVSGTTTYRYDLGGNLVSSTDARGATTTRAHDALGRITTSVATLNSENETTSWTYDESTFGIGRLTRLTDESGVSTYAYDRRGLLREESKSIGATTYTTRYGYDRDGNRSRVTYPSGRVVDYGHDFAGRPVSVTSGATTIVSSATYLPFGPLKQTVMGNGTTRTSSYDDRYRMSTNALAGPGGAIASYSYGYDAVGNVTSIVDLLAPGYNRAFEYDDLSRLSVANSGASLWGTGGYTYDAMGNLRTRTLGTQTSAFTYLGTTPLLSTVTENGVSRGVSYDAAGNERVVGSTAYGYSPANHLIGVGDLAYAYDGRGVRTIASAPLRLSGIHVTPVSTAGGTTATGSVTLSGNASSAVVVALSSDHPAASVPSTVTIPAGESSATFEITTAVVSAPTIARLTATWNGLADTVSITVRPPVPQSLVLTPSTVQGGSTVNATLTLDGTAPSGGTSVGLTSTSTSATPPPSVSVPAGQTGTSFSISTSAVAQDATATITAGTTVSAALSITSAVLTGFTVSPATIEGGGPATAQATLSGPAAPGTTVTLTSSNTSAVPTPIPMSITAGQTQGTSAVPTNIVTAQTPVVVTAARNGVNRTSVVTITPPSVTIAGLSLNPSAVIGTNDVVGTVTLTGNAPSWGTTVSLASADPSLVTVPTSVVIPAGANQGSFAISTSYLTFDWNVNVTATHAGITRTATLSLKKPTGNHVSALYVYPTQMTGPGSASGTVQLSTSVTQGGGVDVVLSSSNPSVASVPSSVRIRKGQYSASFTVAVTSVAVSTTVTITARYGEVNRRVQLTVQPGQAAIDPTPPVLCASTMVVPCLPKLVAQAVVTGPSRYSFYAPELQLLAETEASEVAVKPIAHEYVWFAGQPIAQISGNDIDWYFNDHLGTPVLQTNNAAATVWRVDEEPYGTAYAYRTGALKHQPLRFPGQEETGSELRYNVFRWYRAGWGRYTQVDPLEQEGDPHPYLYAAANPITTVDRYGLLAEVVCARIGIGPFSWTPFRHCRIRVTCDRCEGGKFGGPYDTSVGLERNRRSPRRELRISIEPVGGQYTYRYPINNVDQNDSCQFGRCVQAVASTYADDADRWTPQYRLRGPNSNSFAGHVMRWCGGVGPPDGPFGATGFNQSLGFE